MKVLIAIDPAHDQAAVVHEAARLLPAAKLILVSAWHVPPDLERLAAQVTAEDSFADRVAEAAIDTARAAAEHYASGLADRQVDIVLVRGRPAEAILSAAEAHGVDLIVLGTRRRSELGALLLGSVSHDVMHQAGRAVMIIPTPPDA